MSVDREKMKEAFKECKKRLNLDYARVRIPADCCSCSWDYIRDRYGENSKGLWVPSYHGRDKDWNTKIHIQHDLVDEGQLGAVCQTLRAYGFEVTNNGMDYCIEAKDSKKMKKEEE